MQPADQSIMSIFGHMGFMGQFVSLLIFGLSILALYIFVKRFIILSKKYDDDHLMNTVEADIREGNIRSAKDMCVRTNSPLSRVILKGLQRLGSPIRDIELSMENEIDLEYYEFEKGQNVLSMIAKLAPMLGFIGTIAGVIQIFYTINTTGDYNIESISGGLYVKMITSALGLTLGIVSYVFYFVISNKIRHNIYILDKSKSEFIDSITSPSK